MKCLRSRGSMAISSIALAVSLVAPVVNAEAQERDRPRAAMWVRADRVVSGWAIHEPGGMKLKRMAPETVFDVSGAVKAPAFAPDSKAVAWYDSGTGRFHMAERLEPLERAESPMSGAPAEQIRDRGAWLWARDGVRRAGPITMLMPDKQAETPARWVMVLPEDKGLSNRRFLQGSKNITKFVTSVAVRPRGGGIVAVRPYTLQDVQCNPPECESPQTVKRRVYGQAYLAPITNSLRVGRRIANTAPFNGLAVSAGGSRLAAVGADGRVRVFQLRGGFRRLATYPGVAQGKVTYSPGGYLAISGPRKTIIRDAQGRVVKTPAGITWFRYGPCVGDDCGQLV